MTDDKLRRKVAEMRRLLAMANRGPWEQRHCEVIRLPDGSPDDGGDIVASLASSEEAALIVAAVNAMPALLDELEAIIAREARRLASIRWLFDKCYIDDSHNGECPGDDTCECYSIAHLRISVNDPDMMPTREELERLRAARDEDIE